ncbi:MAG: hypothetical protein U0L24_06655 [Lachnospiraceae bacterium]|jgi:putative membrane protein|nr:hypothetical protein [Lachnospiraceae bacterium]HCI18578.1 hypothetical protein [Lachnospiraceae bacterium]HCX41086.1 hypothetical protein [Lachnospiraceae bacterium]
MDDKIRSVLTHKISVKKITFTVMDILLFLVLTGFALIMRYALRNVVAGDYKMFFEPWVATLREAGGGIKGLSAEFEYVDYTTPYLTILSFISICPFLNTLLLMKLVSIFFDFVAAFAVMAIVYDRTKNMTYGILGYGALLMVPTVLTNGAMWAQCDIIFTSFVLWSLYFMLKDKPAWSMAFYGIAFAFKLQTLFLAPLYVILWMKGKVKLKHFLFLPLMYVIGMIPSLLAGKSFWELISVYFFQANGQMDIYALSHKFPNIYQLIGTDSFLFEYADAGIWVTLGALMILMYCFARKQYEMNACLLLRMGMLLTMTVVFFLPHMHERYAILVDVMAIVYVFFDFRKLYIPVLTILCSFAGYTVYLAQNNIIPMYVYTILFLLLMLDHARACVKGMQDGKIAVGE